jgi:hypothetical protein
VAEAAAIDQTEDLEDEPAMDDLDLFIGLGGDLGAFDNDTAEDDNATDVWNSNSSTSINEAVTDDDLLYTPLFLTVVVDNGTAADGNDTELYDDFLVDTSDDNDTAAAAAGNGTAWEGEASGDGGGLFGEAGEEAAVSLEPSSELEANAKPPLGIACVCSCVASVCKREEKSPLFKIYLFYIYSSTGFCLCCWLCCMFKFYMLVPLVQIFCTVRFLFQDR